MNLSALRLVLPIIFLVVVLACGANELQVVTEAVPTSQRVPISQNTSRMPNVVELQANVDFLLTPSPTRVAAPSILPSSTASPSTKSPATPKPTTLLPLPITSTSSPLTTFDPTSAQSKAGDTVAAGGITITFDDGLESAFTVAFPILRKFGLVGNVAVIVDHIGAEGQMTWEQLDELHDSGWAILSHSMTHRNLTELSDEDLDYELGESHRMLMEHGYRGANFFVAPFHAVDARVNEFIAKYYVASRSIYNYRPQIVPVTGIIGYGSYAAGYPLDDSHEILTVDHLKKYWHQSNQPGNWGPTYLHGLTDATEERFELFAEFLHDEGIRVTTVDAIFGGSDQ